MIPIPAYLRLWRLYALNQHLLKIYYHLSNDFYGEEEEFYKREFSHRINKREKIKREIETCLKEETTLEKESKVSKLVDWFFPAIFSIDYNIQKMIFSADLDRCQSLEIKNIEQYYEFLYSGVMNEDITEMLLEQKSIIEDSVFSEI